MRLRSYQMGKLDIFIPQDFYVRHKHISIYMANEVVGGEGI